MIKIQHCIKYKNKIKTQCTHIAYIEIFEKIYTFIPNDDKDKKLDILLVIAESYLENEDMIGCRKKIAIAEKIINNFNSNKIAAAQIHIIKAIQEIQSKETSENITKSLAIAEKFTAEANDPYTQLLFDKAKVVFLQYSQKYTEAADEAKKIILKCGNSKKFKLLKTKVLLNLGTNLLFSGNHKEAEKTYLETLKNAKKTGNTNIEDTALNNLAVIQERVYKNFEASIVYYEKILKNSLYFF